MQARYTAPAMSNFQSKHVSAVLIRLLLLTFLISLSHPARSTGGANPGGAPGSVSPERRVALVIGNDAYVETTRLERAVADARAMSTEFRKLGFEVIEHTNLDRRGMNRALTEFTDKVQGGGVGVLFFAGHGVQVQGSNYLLPVDVKVSRADDLPDEAIDLGRVMERMAQAKAKFSLMIIDACRDNPFPKTGGRNIGGARGLTIPQAPQGLMVVYSAGVNEQAVDRLGPADQDPNGLFTREFLKVLREPGMTVDAIVKRVRSRVSEQARQAGYQQNPAIYDQASGEFYFRPPAAQVATTLVTPPPASIVAPINTATSTISEPAAIELALWDSVRNTTVPEELQEYLRQFPNGRFAVLARSRLAVLSQRSTTTQSATAVDQAPAPAPSGQSSKANSAGPFAGQSAAPPVTPARVTGASTPAPSGAANRPAGRFFGEAEHFLIEAEVSGDKLRFLKFIVRIPGDAVQLPCGGFGSSTTIKENRVVDIDCVGAFRLGNSQITGKTIRGVWPILEVIDSNDSDVAGRPIPVLRTPDSKVTMIPEALRNDYLAAKKNSASMSTAAFSQGPAAQANNR